MKYKFNESFLGLGYIKETLKEFNLPLIPVATDDSVLYDKELYIKDLGIYRYNKKQDKLIKIYDYYYNRPVFNLTAKMSITTSYYGSDIHEYLGNYLRFLRDYKRINLMSLYNCFSNRTIHPMNYDTNYNYYAIPIKFNQKYTIGLDSNVPITMWCTLWDTIQIKSDALTDVEDHPIIRGKYISGTEMTVNGCKLSDPFLYNKVCELITTNNTREAFDASNYQKYRNNLKLIIRVPAWNKSSLVVLEGDYIFNSNLDSKLTTKFGCGLEGDFDFGIDRYHYINYPTKLSLFKVNDEQMHPFADRLIEYLLNMSITNIDELDDNIKRVQKILYLLEHSPVKVYGDWDESLNRFIYKLEDFPHTNFFTEDLNRYINDKTNRLRKAYLSDSEYVITDSEGVYYNLLDKAYDLLTYVDKDVEAVMSATGAYDVYVR